MKSILLASVSAFAFAGAAAAEVTFGGNANVSYNTLDGTSYGANLTLGFDQALNNGWTVSMSSNIILADNGLTEDDDDVVDSLSITLSGDQGSLSFGEFSSGAAYDAVSTVSGMTEKLAKTKIGNLNGWEEIGVVAKANFAGFTFATSAELDGNSVDDLEYAISGTFGSVSFAAGMQDTWGSDAMGVSMKTSVSGADLTFAHVTDGGDSSTGVGVSYPMGSVTFGFTYAMNSAAADAWGLSVDYAEGPITAGLEYGSTGDWTITGGYAAGAITVGGYFNNDNEMGVDVSYDMGNGLVLKGGFDNVDPTSYYGVEYDLGGGASVTVSYSSSGAAVGPKYAEGTTLALAFEF